MVARWTQQKLILDVNGFGGMTVVLVERRKSDQLFAYFVS